jgi:hypothetical protein
MPGIIVKMANSLDPNILENQELHTINMYQNIVMEDFLNMETVLYQ